MDAATKHGIPVGNTPGVLTETTAELAAALTLAAARRVAEADVFMRAGHYKGWLPTLFVGQLLQGKTVGIIGAGRIGAAYARMMVEGHKMNLVYYDPYPNKFLEVWLDGGCCVHARYVQEENVHKTTHKRLCKHSFSNLYLPTITRIVPPPNTPGVCC